MLSSNRRRRPRPCRYAAAGRRHQFELLERRLVLSSVVTIDPAQTLGTISPDLMGTNLLYAFERDAAWQDGQIVADLKELGVGFLRYPGGAVTSQYHWNDMMSPTVAASLRAGMTTETRRDIGNSGGGRCPLRLCFRAFPSSERRLLTGCRVVLPS